MKVKDGKVVTPNAKPDEYVVCDRCGKKFLAKYVYCTCRG